MSRLPGIYVVSLDEPASGGSQDVWRGKAQVYAKSSTSNPMLVVNEFIAAHLAYAVGLPTPAGEVAADGDAVSWVTLEVDGATGPPPEAARVVNQHERAARRVVHRP